MSHKENMCQDALWARTILSRMTFNIDRQDFGVSLRSISMESETIPWGEGQGRGR